MLEWECILRVVYNEKLSHSNTLYPVSYNVTLSAKSRLILGENKAGFRREIDLSYVTNWPFIAE